MIWLNGENTERVEAIDPTRAEIIRMRQAMSAPFLFNRMCRVRVLLTGQIVNARLTELIPIPDEPPDVHLN